MKQAHPGEDSEMLEQAITSFRGRKEAAGEEGSGCVKPRTQQLLPQPSSGTAVVSIMWVLWSSYAVNIFPQALFMLEF